MGFFSWRTIDGTKSITNAFSVKGALPVAVLIPKEFGGGALIEKNYQGYGVFGGRDVYALLAQWNYPEQCKNTNGYFENDEFCRGLGIDIACYESDMGKLTYPLKIVTLEYYNKAETIYEDHYGFCENCPNQGYFYDDEEEQEEDD